MACFLGIDIGSATSKGIIVKNGKTDVYHMLPSGANYKAASEVLKKQLLAKAKLDDNDITRTITTGHGEGLIAFSDKHIPDIQCCAKGINRIFPAAEMVIDIQSQSSQVIHINDNGQVTDFIIGEVCAGGSGSFLEAISNVLQIELHEIGPLSLSSHNPVTFSTGCAVFGESEAISMVAEGISKEDILAGVHQMLAHKISALIKRIGLKEPCAVSGGGALNIGLIKKVEESGFELLVPPQPQFINALGASIIAFEGT